MKPIQFFRSLFDTKHRSDAQPPLVKMTAQAQRLAHVIWSLPLVLIFVILGIILGNVVFRAIVTLAGLSGEPAASWTLLQYGFYEMSDLIFKFAGMLIPLYLWTRFFEKRPFQTLGLPRQGAIAKFALGLLGGFIQFGVVALISVVLGAYSFGAGDLAINPVSALIAVGMIAIGYMVQSSTEEIIYRGWVLPMTGARHTVTLGIIASALIFAVLHGANPGISPLAIINLVLFGTFAALLALWQGNIWSMCGLHAAWNWVQGNVFGIRVSGTETGATLFAFQQNASAPEIISGGAFGAEGSVIVSIVLLVSIVLVLWAWHKRDGKIVLN